MPVVMRFKILIFWYYILLIFFSPTFVFEGINFPRKFFNTHTLYSLLILFHRLRPVSVQKETICYSFIKIYFSQFTETLFFTSLI